MGRMVRVVLISAVALAVLAFGGTEPGYFSLVQLLLLGCALLFVLAYGKPQVGTPRLPLAVPLLLLVLVLLQLVPLPASIVGQFGGAVLPLSQTSFATLSIAPYETQSQLLLLVTFLAVFYLALAISQRNDGRKHLILALLGLGAFEAFYGLAQYLTRGQFFSSAPVAPLANATGTYINRNHFAGLLELILPFALALAFYQFYKTRPLEPTEPVRRENSFSSAEFPKVLLCLFLAVILFTALVFSRSRMGIVSALVSTLVLILLIATSTRRGKTGTVLPLLFLAGGLLVAIWIGPDPVLDRFTTLEREYAMNGQGRLAIWQDTFNLIRQHPWLGSGFGTFPLAYTSVQTTFLNRFVNHAHNDYLEIISEIGTVGGLLLVGTVLYLLTQTVRRFRAGGDPFQRAVALGCTGSLVAILLHSLTDFNLYIPANLLVFGVVLGLACSLQQSAGGTLSETS